MSFHERRPEERDWLAGISGALQVLLVIVALAAILNNVCLRRELAEANRQLDFHTCRVQLEPMPVPEQTNQSPTPTLLPLEDQ